jgi:Flp pilus assembly protein TadG
MWDNAAAAIRRMQRCFAALSRARDANATLLMAVGMPVLVGGAGLAIDTAQWYQWKGELQYAVDQAAIAGAWAQANNPGGTTYRSRALEEFAANQQVVTFAGTPTVALANFRDGSNNSVIVTATAAKSLPFSGFLTGSGVSITVRAQATYKAGATYTSCILAVNETESGAVTIGGNATVTARCGIAALSTSANAITVNGNPTVDPGWVIAAGGIDDWFTANTDASINEYVSGLVDPFASLTPPTNPTPRTYACTGGTTTYTAIGTQRVLVEDRTYTGTKANKVTTLSRTVTVSDVTIPYSGAASKNTKTGTTTSTSTDTGTVTGSASPFTRIDRVTTTTTTVTGVTSATSPYLAAMQPGTYSDFDTACTTTMASGVYVIDGGSFSINAQDEVLGSGVMIVLRNGAGIRINGGATVNLSAMTVAQLEAAGVSTAQAQKLAGMLVFEDRTSAGNQTTGGKANIINGNAATTLDGKVYLPRSPIRINGTAAVSSQCLMIAANTISILGDADLTSFCPPGIDQSAIVATLVSAVKLVS